MTRPTQKPNPRFRITASPAVIPLKKLVRWPVILEIEARIPPKLRRLRERWFVRYLCDVRQKWHNRALLFAMLSRGSQAYLRNKKDFFTKRCRRNPAVFGHDFGV
jgi:hypothetical protein